MANRVRIKNVSGQVRYTYMQSDGTTLRASSWSTANGVVQHEGATGASKVTHTGIAAIQDLDAPSGDNDATRKIYVDTAVNNAILGRQMKQAKVVETSAVSPLTSYSGTVQGEAIADGHYVLLTNQTLPKDNGLYEVVSDDLVRAGNMNTESEFYGAVVVITGGTGAGNMYICDADSTSPAFVMDTTAVAFNQIGTAVTATPSNGITVSGVDLALTALAANSVFANATAGSAIATAVTMALGTMINRKYAGNVQATGAIEVQSAKVGDVTNNVLIGKGASQSGQHQFLVESTGNNTISLASDVDLNQHLLTTSDVVFNDVEITSDSTTKNVGEMLKAADALNMVLKMQPHYFSYKSSPDIARVGFIAQNVQEHLPQAVGEKIQKEENGDESKTLTLRNIGVTAANTGAIQAMHQKVCDNSGAIAELKAEIALLRKRKASPIDGADVKRVKE